MPLPDINVDNVGHIAWWNALDHDASFLNPNELEQYDGVNNSTVYQNGIVGTLDRDPRLRWRAKTDGWMVVFYDVTESGRPADYAFIPEFHNGNVDLYQNVMAEELNNLRLEASNAGEMDFNYEDVGFADYRSNPAIVYEAYQYDPGIEARYAYTENNQPRALHLRGRSEMNVNGESISKIVFNERDLVPEQDGEGVSSGTVEAVANGWLNDDAEVHYMTGGVATNPDSEVQACALAVYD